MRVAAPHLVGAGTQVAARQVAALFALAGVLALVGITNDTRRAGDLLIIAAADLGLAVFVTVFRWAERPPLAPVLLALPAFAVLGFSTWAFGGVATGTGPFLVLIFAWAALHYSRRVLLALVPPALLAYLLPLILTDQPAAVLGSSVVLLPVALGVALLIEAQARNLREDSARIAEIERWRAALVAALAHDLRSPLSIVQMVLEDLRDDPGAHAGEFIEKALRQVARIDNLTSGLLDLDRIDTQGKLRLDLRPWPVREVVSRAVAHLRADDVVIEIDPALTLTMDRDRFEQIVVNLVGNGLRHGGPPVLVRVTAEGGIARLEVRDHGPGVPEAVRPRLFTRFGSDNPGSVGLGLWIVGQLAQAHGGEAHHEDTGSGARMVVTWPAPDRLGPDRE
ncbi:sensor histidine kinase [Actinoplanes sp. NPDC049599]|uniref:sensor histidine kinase n=1 Tax=Actinoplanes sp. NPDC049599 TaxID=3363903 RepID=UPI00378C8F68